MKSGRYVIFYNERLDGVTYPEDYVSGTVFTELCDVIVHGKQTCVCLFVCFVCYRCANKGQSCIPNCRK